MTIEVAEGSEAKLSCQLNNREQSDQIMWYSRSKKQNKDYKGLQICAIPEDERKHGCIRVTNKELDSRLR